MGYSTHQTWQTKVAKSSLEQAPSITCMREFGGQASPPHIWDLSHDVVVGYGERYPPKFNFGNVSRP